eukprot:TRINITY_DN11871_c0_g1_i1.p1 TRINITY_DN11871_c0_g1~~TRINITY_DN11871_c0_g1_i1.p1  ORF type:complete len:600 (-),score=70.98 TRINITY_DN11871_c0_g1_i1:30-1829(-)
MFVYLSSHLPDNIRLGEDERVYVTGSSKALGEWNVNNALVMDTTDGRTFGCQYSEEEGDIEYKFITKNNNGLCKYETLKGMQREFRVSRELLEPDTVQRIAPQTFDKSYAVRDGNFGKIELQFRFGLHEKSPGFALDGHDDENQQYTFRLESLKADGEKTPLELQILRTKGAASGSIIRSATELGRYSLADFKHKILIYSYTLEAGQMAVENDLAIVFTISNADDTTVFGQSKFFPVDLLKSQGQLCASIHDSSGLRVGSTELDYLWLRPYYHPENNVRKTFGPSGSGVIKKNQCTVMGHRGAGGHNSPFHSGAYTENTIQSFIRAHKVGAKFVEFDVHLTKDSIPVVYHDFDVLEKNLAPGSPPTKRAIPSLKLKELRSMSLFQQGKSENDLRSTVRNIVELRRNNIWNDDDFMAKKSTRVLPKLHQLFRDLPPELGFNIEVKYPDLKERRNEWIDKNFLVDEILNVIMNPTYLNQNRKIFFSSFDADICALLRKKQLRYPVMFLSQLQRAPDTDDPRIWSLPMCVLVTKSLGLAGFVGCSTPLLRDANLSAAMAALCEKKKYRIVTWGADNNSSRNVREQRRWKVNGIITDNIIGVT